GQGVVRVRNLVGYLQKAVYGAVQREEGKEQTPYPVIEGPGATELVLASGRPPGAGGDTAADTMDASARGRFEAALQLGYEFLRQHAYGEAERRFREALGLDSRSALPWTMLGVVAHEQWKKGEAETCFRKALELDPRQARALNGLGNACDDHREYDQAERLY